jgi:hypothetical protein
MAIIIITYSARFNLIHFMLLLMLFQQIHTAKFACSIIHLRKQQQQPRR